MSLLATAAFVLPLVPQPAPYQMPAPGHERVVLSQAGGSLNVGVPQSIWVTDGDAKGTHLQSTLTCAKTVGEFERTDLHIFDGFGLDVGCNYNRPGGGAITIYIARRKGESLDDDFKSADAAIAQRWSDVKAADAGTVTSPTGLTFQSVMYARADGTRTGLWAADVSGWTYSIRATFAPELAPKVKAALDLLTEAVRATSGTHLAACAAAPAVTRDGKIITDQDRIMTLSLIAGSMEAAVDEKLGPNVKLAENWCAEEGGGDNEAPMLFWRNIATGNAGASDRVTLMTMDAPPTLLSVANPTASFLDDDKSANKPMVHQLTEKRGDTTYVFAFFAGRPAFSTLTALSKDIFLGRANPVTSFNGKTNTITIPMGTTKPGT